METLCYKCHLAKANYKIRLQLVCKACFVSNTEHMFRCTLKNCIFPRNGEKMLICVSGGPNSSAMLSLIDTCNNPLKTKKMMKFIPTILYIDDSIVYKTPSSTVESFISTIESTYKYPVLIRKIEELVPNILEALPAEDQTRSDMLYYNIHASIIEVAKQLGIKKVVTAETASRISTRVLSGICKGSGVSVNQDSEPCHAVDGISVGRPMRELLDKEVCIYVHITQVPVITKLIISDYNVTYNGNIDTLVQDFLQNLQSKFPSTVHTLLRTASKLMPISIPDTCRICKKPKDKPVCPLENFCIMDESLCYSCHHLINS
jgi:cytoplasmic tRNA 2-thiolation protein 2